MSDKLTAKQLLFCKEYLVDKNATQAAIRAGYSEKAAGSISAENMQKPAIKEKIQAGMNKISEKLEITAENILQDIVETRTEAAGEGKHGDRLRANELLGKHLKLFTENIAHSGGIDNRVKVSDNDRELLNKYIQSKQEPTE